MIYEKKTVLVIGNDTTEAYEQARASLPDLPDDSLTLGSLTHVIGVQTTRLGPDGRHYAIQGNAWEVTFYLPVHAAVPA